MVDRDVSLLATRVGAVIVVFTVCTFGYVGSPGAFGALGSMPLEKHVRSYTAASPRWNGEASLSCFSFVDDSALVSLRAGVCEGITESCYLHALHSMFGPSGLNVEKDKKVGLFLTKQKYCGLIYDLKNGTVGLGPARLCRAIQTLENPTWRYGNTNISSRDMQSLHGQTRWYAQACRPLHGMHSNISAMLSTTDPMGLRVKPPGTASAVKHKWMLFWETLELHRIILQKEAEFSASYLSTFLGAVPLARRLAILEERQKAVVLELRWRGVPRAMRRVWPTHGCGSSPRRRTNTGFGL